MPSLQDKFPDGYATQNLLQRNPATKHWEKKFKKKDRIEKRDKEVEPRFLEIIHTLSQETWTLVHSVSLLLPLVPFIVFMFLTPEDRGPDLPALLSLLLYSQV